MVLTYVLGKNQVNAIEVDCIGKDNTEVEHNVFDSIEKNLIFIKEQFGEGIGLNISEYSLLEGRVNIVLAFIENLSDDTLISNQIVKPLLEFKMYDNTSSKSFAKLSQSNSGKSMKLLGLLKTTISIPDIQESSRWAQVTEGLLAGQSVLFIDNLNKALLIKTRKVEKKTIDKPFNEAATFAGKEAFTEDLGVNCSMIIDRLQTSKLHFEEYILGNISHTRVKLIWLKGIASMDVINEARSRLEKVDVDYFDGIGNLAELVQDAPLQIFPTYIQTERPDKASFYLTKGHFVILCSNSPFAFIAPASLWDHYKTADDYSEMYLPATLIRIIRLIASLISIFISSIYLSFTTYNHNITPLNLAFSIASGRENVPFPTVIELLFMSFVIDIIRESGIRMPGAVGFAISTLGAVVIGQAAVSAGYVSPSLIIIISIAALSNFAITSPLLINPFRLLNYFLLFFSSLFGIFGFINGVLIIIWRVATLKSFGVSYLYPLLPYDAEGNKDTIIRAPMGSLRTGLKSYFINNRKKQDNQRIAKK